MLNNNLFKKKSVWIYCLLSVLCVLVIFSIIKVIIVGPSNFIDECLELFGGANKQTWVFLVAGSKGWDNYRHQADVSHAYQTLLKNGIPVDRIIVMMTDDVAFDSKNPYRGELFNHPNGSDVYQGVQVDYKGEEVNSEHFLNVLNGNKAAMTNLGSGRVIESNHRDNIFVYFVGHGTSGILAFPENYLYADELNNALQSMYSDHKFNSMLLYIESCRAGSLFDGILSESNNIFAVTAAGPRESSWSIYCIGEDEIPDLCLGDEFSCTWIEDQANLGILYPSHVNELVEKRTVLNHFNYIRTSVKLSNVMPYGDFSVGQNKLSAYIGKSPEVFSKYSYQNSDIPSFNKHNGTNMFSYKFSNNTYEPYQTTEQPNGKNNTMKPSSIYNSIMRKIMDRTFNTILRSVIKKLPGFIGHIDELKELPSNLPLNVFPCYRQTLDHITANCFSLPKNKYSLNEVHIFFNLCTRVIDSEWKSEEFYNVFEQVVHNVCSKNASMFSNLLKMTDIY
ncbi:legumain-like isoform X2 [Metopolophium dirhodum]|uniref:legumain-like isoform X2 n=1 Tax=Metopolophium dirhodum TaxID=44670 RepID=UPI00299002C8|nr:legumain-like isoform X2 [Metopolophium dirhodum]